MENYTRFARLFGAVTLFLALITGNLSLWADTQTKSKAPVTVKDTAKPEKPMSFPSDILVMRFDPLTGQWPLATFKQLKTGNEFTFVNYLYRTVESGKALLVPGIDISKLIEADKPFNNTFYRRPTASDAVQVLGKNEQFVSHEVLSTVPAGTKVRFQGRVYEITPDRSLIDTGITFPTLAPAAQQPPSTYKPGEITPNGTSKRIEITESAMQHIIDRHTVGGRNNSGTSIFNPGVDIETLIRNAKSIKPVLEPNGYLKRVVKAGRNIGYDGRSRKQTRLYRVITTQSEILVTAYPVLK